MAQADDTQGSRTTDGQFGANAWLIDEMREHYRIDPSSVGADWAAFFEREAGNKAPSTPTGPAATPPAAAPAPAPVATAGSQPAAAAPRNPGVDPTTEPNSLASKGGPQGPGSGTGVSADRPRPQPQAVKQTPDPVRTPLRGAAGRTAANMDASIAMPTATSVREVPMKLAIDQRAMINAHLARTTGGKGLLHPPHRLGNGAGIEGRPGDEQLL